MRIFLSGGGSGEKSKQTDLAFLDTIDKTKPVLYVPLARKAPFDSCREWIISNFKPLDFSNFRMIESFDELCTLDLSKFSAIYIGGGNTYSLLKGLKESGTLKLLKNYIENNGILYGGSAGAIILGMDIKTSKSKNEVLLEDETALSAIYNFSVFCHYKEEDKQKILDYKKQTNNNVIALPEDAGVFIDNEEIRVFGPGSLFIFALDELEVLPGKTLSHKFI